jgi:hypothetical protein
LLRPLKNPLVILPLKLRIGFESSLPFSSGNVRMSLVFLIHLSFVMFAVCAFVVIAEISNGILLRRYGGWLVLLVRPLLDHFDGLFCGRLGIDHWV